METAMFWLYQLWLECTSKCDTASCPFFASFHSIQFRAKVRATSNSIYFLIKFARLTSIQTAVESSHSRFIKFAWNRRKSSVWFIMFPILFMWKCTRSFISDVLCTTAAVIFIKPSNDNSGKAVNTNEFLWIVLSVRLHWLRTQIQKNFKWISLLKLFHLLFKFMQRTKMFKAWRKVI